MFADVCETFQDRVLPYAPRETPQDTRDRARRVVTSTDPEGAAARRRRAKRACDVTARALDDGLALIEATVPALDAAAVMAKVTDTVNQLIRERRVDELGPPCDAPIGQVRTAVLAHLIRDGGLDSSGASTTVEVGVLIDAGTLAEITPDGPSSSTSAPTPRMCPATT